MGEVGNERNHDVNLLQIASNGWMAAVLLCLIWLVSFALPPPLQSRVLREANDAPTLRPH